MVVDTIAAALAPGGKATVTRSGSPGAAVERALGGIIGGLAGLVGGPVGVALGVMVGSAIGAAVGWTGKRNADEATGEEKNPNLHFLLLNFEIDFPTQQTCASKN